MLDDIDTKILQKLSQNSRISYVDLEKEIGLSRVAVRDRIDKLVEKGIIEQFSIVINAEKLGKKVSAYLEIDVEPQHFEEVASALANNEKVAILYQMTGPCRLHMHTLTEDYNTLNEFLDNDVYSLKGIVRVETHLLLKRFKSQDGINI